MKTGNTPILRNSRKSVKGLNKMNKESDHQKSRNKHIGRHMTLVISSVESAISHLTTSLLYTSPDQEKASLPLREELQKFISKAKFEFSTELWEYEHNPNVSTDVIDRMIVREEEE